MRGGRRVKGRGVLVQGMEGEMVGGGGMAVSTIAPLILGIQFLCVRHDKSWLMIRLSLPLSLTLPLSLLFSLSSSLVSPLLSSSSSFSLIIYHPYTTISQARFRRRRRPFWISFNRSFISGGHGHEMGWGTEISSHLSYSSVIPSRMVYLTHFRHFPFTVLDLPGPSLSPSSLCLLFPLFFLLGAPLFTHKHSLCQVTPRSRNPNP